MKGNEGAIPISAQTLALEEIPYVQHLINMSKLSSIEWIRSYLEIVVLPLYHLQFVHGVGLVVHGQNTVLVLENSAPKSLIIKDFHGDLRVSTTSMHLKSETSLSHLDKLPSQHLIHDLITGHFVTVLRYLSRALKDCEMISEKDFYQELKLVIQEYYTNFSVDNVEPELNLLRSHFEKILVNKVRFIQGYNETSERLKPVLGSLIRNPICDNEVRDGNFK